MVQVFGVHHIEQWRNRGRCEAKCFNGMDDEIEGGLGC